MNRAGIAFVRAMQFVADIAAGIERWRWRLQLIATTFFYQPGSPSVWKRRCPRLAMLLRAEQRKKRGGAGPGCLVRCTHTQRTNRGFGKPEIILRNGVVNEWIQGERTHTVGYQKRGFADMGELSRR